MWEFLYGPKAIRLTSAPRSEVRTPVLQEPIAHVLRYPFPSSFVNSKEMPTFATP